MKGNRKRWLSSLLALCMLISLAPAAQAVENGCTCSQVQFTDGVAVHEESCPLYTSASATGTNGITPLGNGEHSHGGKTFTAWDGSVTTLSGGDYYLSEDVSVADISVTGDVTLCLNGHTLTLSAWGSLEVKEGSNFTVCDCQYSGSGTGGTVTSAATYATFAIASVRGNFTLESGSISGSKNGAVYVSGGNFTMTGGEITGNTGSQGVGVKVDSGSFLMTDGKITGNTGSQGGGVYVASNGSFTMSGGEISGNQATGYGSIGGGGVYVAGGNFTVSGSAKVTDNITDGSVDNVYLSDGQSISVGTLESGASIGISMANSTGVFASSGGAGQAGYFFSDDSQYAVRENGDTLELVVATHSHCACGDESCVDPEHGGVVDFQPLSSLDGMYPIFQSGDYYLTKDVALADDITIRADVTLCLNGHQLILNDNMITIETMESLIVCDCQGAGKIIGGNSVAINLQGGRFTLNSGTITGSSVLNGNGVVYIDGLQSAFTMNGGELTGNSGSSVYVEGGGIFTMTGGKITNNTSNFAGGVCVTGRGSFTMTGGEITNNTTTSSGGGVYLSSDGAFTVSGNAKVTGNKQGDSASNVYLANSALITVGEGGLTSGASIGVSMDFPGVFTTNGAKDYQAYFFSDSDEYSVHASGNTLTLEESGTSEPGKPETPDPVAPPSDENITSDSITIPTESGKEYAVVPKGETPQEDEWVDGTGSDHTFDNLQPDTEYDILVRVPADGDTPASDPAKTTVTTEGTGTTEPEKPETPDPVAPPSDENITSDSITIPTENGKEYAVVPKGETPQEDEWVDGTGSDHTFDNLQPDTEYDILVRVPADGDTPASDPAKTTVTTEGTGTSEPGKPETPDPVAPPSDENITSDSITIPTESGKEYAVVPKGETPEEDDWVVGTGSDHTFDNLQPDTEYDILVRVPADGDTPASDPAKTTVTTGGRYATVTWSGLNQVYGDTTEVQATVSGVEPGDDVQVSITGAGQAAGTYKLTATLIGANASDYFLKNATATLVIQQKSVVITVTNNVTTTNNVTPPTINAPGLEKEDYEIIYKDEDGRVVDDPTAPGTYEVRVKITDPNYRHPDGSSEKQVGTFTIANTLPTLYTVAFAGGDGATGTTIRLEVVEGDVLTLPTCDFTKYSYQFTGWTYDGKTYQPGDRFTMPNKAVTFMAQWEKTFEVTVTVEEETASGPVAVEDAVVSLWLGANKLSEVITDGYGEYTFTNLASGIYNLVVTKDVRTVTKKVEIATQDQACDATLPKGATNSIVKVAPGSPDIVVGQLNTVFEKTDDTVYTPDDKDTVEAGGKVEITFTAEEKQKGDQTIAEDMDKIAASKDESVILGLVMDYRLEKTVSQADGTSSQPTPITQANVLLEILLPLSAELQDKDGYSVYRVHEGTAQELSMVPSADLGEYFAVNNDKTGLVLYVKCFSTYAIGYTESAGDDDNDGNGGSHNSGSSGGTAPAYPPQVEQPEHGSVTTSPKNPQKGDKVTITPTPDEGYVVDKVTVTDSKGQTVDVTPNADGTYTFVQPSGKVTITVTFRELADVPGCPRDESCPMAMFTDTDRSTWYHDGVHYCLEQGLMVGTSETTFEPDAATTRGMVATILWRMAGSPIVSHSMAYDDVNPADWYAEAIRWADSKGIATGYGNGRFGPDDCITREEMAAMLWRYAGSPDANGALSGFQDGMQTSGWAQPAMIWAVEQGLFVGTDNNRLDPQGPATRAEVATILMRLAQTMA